ncbi:MAG TPA: PEFG-CTERM sorting domain-containing protein [Nitrosopumilaceae archaeon]|nr:PEFG-CTERM sorting domain-containing protein [Nitrosopumilaceae archaeon]
MNSKKSKCIYVLFLLIFVITLPEAFAANVDVSIPSGTSVQGCEKTNECFVPASVTVHPKDTVTWTNNDSAAHTVTSGTAKDGPDGKFDSSLFMAGKTFSHKFDTLGNYPYFCIVHPWMIGNVLNTVGGGIEVPLGKIIVGGDDMPKETVATAMSSDGSVRVEIVTGKPTPNETLSLETRFRDASGGGLKTHVNYDIMATHNEKIVLSEIGIHQHEGTGNHITTVLGSNDPVNIKVTLNGFGLPGEEAKWTGPKGEVVTLQVVPEFGTIAMMMLVVSIVSIIAITAKTRVIPKL